ncbi:hypothetical protein DIPPA_23009 [Diplonema papillatum]|nr:hypothetical protein DIPPA_23009 [Diplonema papillatum]
MFASSMHPAVVDRLCVPRTELWAKKMTSGTKHVVTFKNKEFVLSNVALAGDSKTAEVQVLTDGGAAVIASLSAAANVLNATVWFRLKAGEQTTISVKKGDVDVLGYTVADEPDVDPDDIMPPVNLPVDNMLSPSDRKVLS